jgi:hypothetical protein
LFIAAVLSQPPIHIPQLCPKLVKYFKNPN